MSTYLNCSFSETEFLEIDFKFFNAVFFFWKNNNFLELQVYLKKKKNIANRIYVYRVIRSAQKQIAKKNQTKTVAVIMGKIKTPKSVCFFYKISKFRKKIFQKFNFTYNTKVSGL